MNFFETLSSLSEGLDLTIKVKKKNEKLTISILPNNIEKIMPLVLTGTPAELDEGFFKEISEPIQQASGIVKNIEGYKSALKDAEEAAKKESETKSTGSKKLDKIIDKKKKSNSKPPNKKKSSAAPAKTEEDNTDEDAPVQSEEKAAPPQELKMF